MLESSESPNRARTLPWIRTVAWLLGAGLGWWALHLSHRRPDWVERYYSQGLYPRLRKALSWISGHFPFSLAETLALLVITVLLTWLGIGIRDVLRRRTLLWQASVACILRCLRMAALAYLCFLLLWGGNHARQPLSVSSGLGPVEDKQSALEALARSLVHDLARDHAAARTPEGFAVFDRSHQVDGRILEALQGLSSSLPHVGGDVPALRSLRFWPLFARLGISGIFIPFTGEPHFNGGMPACRWPFVAFHEIAHQRGFAREDEANFLGWVLCVSSDDAHYRYSGNLAALSSVVSALRRHDSTLANELVKNLPEPVLQDIRAVRAFWKAYESPARTLSVKMNDVYLKSQGQSHGVLSYGRMVELMLSYRASDF
jgi:hypothetical protein